MQTHKQVRLKVRGRTIQVDAGIRQLIQRLNALPGIKTYYSCQGHRGYADAYVLFAGAEALTLFLVLTITFIKQCASGSSPGHQNGGGGDSVLLEVSDGGFVMRWDPVDYPWVLRLLEQLPRQQFLPEAATKSRRKHGKTFRATKGQKS